MNAWYNSVLTMPRFWHWLWYLIATLLLSGILLLAYLFFFTDALKRTLATPLSRLGYIQLRDNILDSDQPKRVLGFLPYWTMAEASPSAAVTDVAYFSVTIDGSGSLVERTNGEVDMGLHRLQGELFESWLETTQEYGQKMHITITLLNNDDISALLTRKAAQEKAIFTITQLLASYPFEGVVMDLEYSGSPEPVLRENYTKFIADLEQALDSVDEDIELSVAVYGSAASKYQIWDVEKIGQAADFLVVMSYDYHVRSSSVVGPVAPIFGRGSGRWEDDIVSNMRDLLLVVPAEKVLLGIPFYGYEWTATSENLGATTFPQSGSTATYKRVLELLSDPEVRAEEKWDEDALSPYIVYKEGGNTQFIYYENARSFSYKLDFVEQVGLAGIAIWALGYEGPNPELWKVVEQKFSQ